MFYYYFVVSCLFKRLVFGLMKKIRLLQEIGQGDYGVSQHDKVKERETHTGRQTDRQTQKDRQTDIDRDGDTFICLQMVKDYYLVYLFILQSISRAFVNGSTLERLVEFGLEVPNGLAIDWLAQNMYWTDSGTQRIEMSRLNGSSRKVIVWKDVKPIAIAVDPPQG